MSSLRHPARGDGLVVFGLTGDLGHDQLLPGIALLHATDGLGVPVVGVGRSRPDDLDALLLDAIDDEFALRLGTTADRLVEEIDLRFVEGDGTDSDTWDAIAAELDGTEVPVVYAALPPQLLGDLAAALADSPLPQSTRLVLEKPFGEDATTARALYDEITDRVDPERLFLVDHFLAKGAVHNLVTVRRSPLLDLVLRRDHLEAVTIDFPESGGLDARGSFYESVGVVADVVQNHLLQTVGNALLDPPDDRTPDAVRRARIELLRSVAPIDPAHAVLGQYEGYRELDDVDDESTVPTYLDVRLDVDTPRWRDLPVRLRTGKQLAPAPFTVTWQLAERGDDAGHRVGRHVRARLQPDPAVEIDLATIDPTTHGTTASPAVAPINAQHGACDAYAVVLSDAITGDRRHMSSIEEIVECWRIVEPILDAPAELLTYAPGSTGP